MPLVHSFRQRQLITRFSLACHLKSESVSTWYFCWCCYFESLKKLTIVNYQGSSIASIDRVSVAKRGVRQDDSLPVRLVAAIWNVKYNIEFDSKNETSFRPIHLPWKFLPALMTASNNILCKLLVLWLAVERKLVRWLSVRHLVDLEPFHCGLVGLESIQGLFKHEILLTLRKPGMILSTSWMSFRFSARGSLTSIAITLMLFVLRLI